MREINNTKIIAVDHGYGNIKTANTLTPTGITAYESEPIFTGNILEYNGIYYRILERCVPIRINNRNIRQDNASKNLEEAKRLLL